MNDFPVLIHKLGELIGEPLEVDAKGACSLEINHSLKVQIELDSSGESILLLSLITELPPGKFRENILKDGLKANFLAEEKQGTLSYIDRQNALVLFQYLPTQTITEEILYEHLMKFISRASLWLSAIESGHSSPDVGEIPPGSNKQGPMLGFK